MWTRPGRYYIELHGLDDPNARRLIRFVERGLESHAGVSWARVNAPSRRVVVAVGSPPSDRRELVRVVESAERHAKVHADEDDDACLELHHPCEGPRTPTAVSALAADAVGLGLSALTRLSHWVPLPTEMAALPATFQHHPKLRALAGKGMHSQHDADSVLPMVSALAQGLAAGGEGIVLDGAQRIAEWREARAYQAAWRKAEPELVSGPEHAAADPVVERPGPPPADPIYAYAERAMGMGAVGGLALMPFFGLRRGIDFALTSLPKAPAAGRHGFATPFGRILAQRGVIVMDRGVLRRLGYLDTIVLDANSLRTGRHELTSLVPVSGADPTEAAESAYPLFDPREPDRLAEDDGWRLGPLDRLDLSGTTGKQTAAKLRKQGAERVIGLARGSRLRAVAGVSVAQPEGMQAMAAAARRSGAGVVIATDADQKGFAYADSVVPATGLTEAVHELQADGAAVLVVSGNRTALGAADCGVGFYREGAPPAWGAHILVGSDIEAAAHGLGSGVGDRATRAEERHRRAAAGRGAQGFAGQPTRPRHHAPCRRHHARREHGMGARAADWARPPSGHGRTGRAGGDAARPNAGHRRARSPRARRRHRLRARARRGHPDAGGQRVLRLHPVGSGGLEYRPGHHDVGHPGRRAGFAAAARREVTGCLCGRLGVLPLHGEKRGTQGT